VKNMEKLFIYGASGHGKVVADIAKLNGYKVEFIDDGENEYLDFDTFLNRYKKANISLGIGDNHIRYKIYKKLKKYNYNVCTLIHPSAIISDNVKIGEGSVIMPNVVINHNVTIKKGSILNTGCIVEHDCNIGKFVHISPNVALAGNVKINKFTHLGIGSSVIQNITIGKNCIVGAGAVVINDIDNNKKVVGVPAKEI